MTDKKTEALKALEEIHPGNMTPIAEEAWNKAITAIREALAEQPAQQDIPKIGCVNHDCDKCKAQQQEPYAWMAIGGTIWRHKTTQDDVPLYTTLPHKPWVGLTEEERNWLRKRNQKHDDYAKAVEALLKEKNT